MGWPGNSLSSLLISVNELTQTSANYYIRGFCEGHRQTFIVSSQYCINILFLENFWVDLTYLINLLLFLQKDNCHVSIGL